MMYRSSGKYTIQNIHFKIINHKNFVFVGNWRKVLWVNILTLV